jgi:hypothetical protein
MAGLRLDLSARRIITPRPPPARRCVQVRWAQSPLLNLSLTGDGANWLTRRKGSQAVRDQHKRRTDAPVARISRSLRHGLFAHAAAADRRLPPRSLRELSSRRRPISLRQKFGLMGGRVRRAAAGAVAILAFFGMGDRRKSPRARRLGAVGIRDSLATSETPRIDVSAAAFPIAASDSFSSSSL